MGQEAATLLLRVRVDPGKSKSELQNIYAVATNLAKVSAREATQSTRETSRATQELTRARKADEQAVRANEREVERWSRVQKKSLSDAEREYDRLTGSVEKNFEKQAKSALKSLDQIEKAQKKATGGGVALPRTFAGFTPGGLGQAGLAIAGYAGVQAIAGGTVDFIKQSKDAYRDYVEYVNRSQVVFGEANKNIMEWSKTTADSLNLSSTQAINYAGKLGALFNGLQLGQDKTANMTVDLLKRIADVSSFSHRSLEDTYDAFVSGLNGMERPLRDFGVYLDEATLKQRALEMGLIKSTKETLPTQIKIMASYDEIMHQTNLHAGDLARTHDSLANQERRLAAQTEDLKKQLGEQLIPAFVKITTESSKWIDTFKHADTAIGILLKERKIPQWMIMLGKLANAPFADAGLARETIQTASQTVIKNREPAGKAAQFSGDAKMFGDAYDALKSGKKNPEDLGKDVYDRLESYGYNFGYMPYLSPGWREAISQEDIPGILDKSQSWAESAANAAMKEVRKKDPKAEPQWAKIPEWKMKQELEDDFKKQAQEEKAAKKRAREAAAADRKKVTAGQKAFNNRVAGFSAEDDLEFSNMMDAYAASTPVQGVGSIYKGLAGITGTGSNKILTPEAVERLFRVNKDYEGLDSGWENPTEKYRKYVEAGKTDAEHSADMRESSNDQELEKLRVSYDFIINFLTTEQESLNDAIQEAIERGDTAKAKQLLSTLSDNKAQMALNEYNRALAERTPGDAYEQAIGAGILPEDYLEKEFSQKILASQRELKPYQDQVRLSEQTQKMIDEMRQYDEKNKRRDANRDVGRRLEGDFQNNASDFFTRVLQGGGVKGAGKQALKSFFGDAMQEAGRDITKEISRAVVDPLKSVFSEIIKGLSSSATGLLTAAAALNALNNLRDPKKRTGTLIGIGIGAIAGSLLGNPIAGAGLGGTIGGMFAEGGRMPTGRASWVGERGRELIVPQSPSVALNERQIKSVVQSAGGGRGDTNISIGTINERSDAEFLVREVQRVNDRESYNPAFSG